MFEYIFSFASACSLHALLNKRHKNGISGILPSVVSQEQLVRKAASLCYLLCYEGTVSLVSVRVQICLIPPNHLYYATVLWIKWRCTGGFKKRKWKKGRETCSCKQYRFPTCFTYRNSRQALSVCIYITHTHTQCPKCDQKKEHC